MARFNLALLGLCLVGFLLSSYAYSVELHAERARQLGITYSAYCDIGPFSCTRVFLSQFGSVTQFVGLPKVSNALVGMLYYMLGMSCCWHPSLILMVSAPSVLITVGFAFILIVVLQDFCMVCCSLYVVNLTTAYMAYRWWRRSVASKAVSASPSDSLKKGR
ncbi:hypothetical protein JKF63_03398 [Porcisia hertigi]|uniref:vitamin-K-epoxide reductase (warfarin-sensitive) n=1 Tax=Porcisia hertigi TaxID=2761500 RepID=A0A836IS53_9TRYP|nr:hypothetical protein JKF63_03398 [Porcisia hertigi]